MSPSDSDPRAFKNIVIAGGGSAGWMAAVAISSCFPDKHVTIVDSTTIGPIGVGESVTGVVIEFVNEGRHGLSLGDFFRHCDATLKLGIRYQNWMGVGTEYLAPIDNPTQYYQDVYRHGVEEFYAVAASEGIRLGEDQLFGRLMRSLRSDYFRNPDGSVNQDFAFSSCHMDALAFAAWLSKIAAARPNVTHIDDVVVGFAQDAESGHLTHLKTRSGREVAGDLFFDCTGFHRLLLAKAYQPKFRSYADYIRLDSAIPHFEPYAQGQRLPNYTMALAMPNGWLWQIPTQSRFGMGYVFSSRYCSDEQAVEEFRATGAKVPDNPRILRFAPGRFEQQWIGNVCAIGLAGYFSEPLESTTIHSMNVQIKVLTELLLPHACKNSLPHLAATYNRLTAATFDDFADFISFHYHAGRDDTEFWRDYQKPESITENNRARREKWKYAFPSREDFATIHTDVALLTTNLPIWAPMLCAFGMLRPDPARRVLQLTRHWTKLKQNVERYLAIRDHVLAHCLDHSEAIAWLRDRP